MSERYIKLFLGEENLYCDNAPIVIRASALLKDTQTGNVLAQLKFQNISGKIISYVKIFITQLDPAKKAIGEAITFEYLDLTVANAEEFGAKNAITLPNSSTRSFIVGISTVGFIDGTTWHSEGSNWTAAKKDSAVVQTIAVEKAFKEAVDLLNSNTDGNLKKAKELFQSIADLKDVTEELSLCDKKAAELEAFAEKKRLEKETNKKRGKLAKKIILISASSILTLAILFFATFSLIVPSVVDTTGKSLREEGKYQEAMNCYKGYHSSPIWWWDVLDLFQHTYDAMQDCALEEFNYFIKTGNTEAIVDIVQQEPLKSDMLLWNLLLRKDAPVPPSVDETKHEEIYLAVTEVLNFDVAVFNAQFSRSDELFGCFITYLLGALPDDYKDVAQLKDFASTLKTTPYHAYTNSIEHADALWKYKLFRSVAIKNIDYLIGDWKTKDGNFYFSLSNSFYSETFITNLERPAGKYQSFKIIDALLSYNSGSKNVPAFKFEASETNKDEIFVYCYENDTTVTLYRK